LSRSFFAKTGVDPDHLNWNLAKLAAVLGTALSTATNLLKIKMPDGL